MVACLGTALMKFGSLCHIAGLGFGYATDVRSQTQGRASFSMEFLKYAEVPNNIAEQLKTA
jgi:hypothetical protein